MISSGSKGDVLLRFVLSPCPRPGPIYSEGSWFLLVVQPPMRPDVDLVSLQGFLQQLRQLAGRMSSGPRGAGLGIKLLIGAGALAYGVKEATYTGNWGMAPHCAKPALMIFVYCYCLF